MIVAQVVIAVVAGSIAVLGAASLAGRRGGTRAQRALREGGTPARRRSARKVVVRGTAVVGDEQVALVRATAAVMLERRREVASPVSMVFLCLAQGILASSWVLAALVLAGVANAAVAVVMADRWLCARRFLDEHPDLKAEVGR